MTSDRQAARTDRLPFNQLLFYALPGLPLAALTLPIYIYLPAFYAQDLGLGLTVVGGILLFARLFDVVSDPLVGFFSDRIAFRWGRRKSWIVVGVPLIVVAIYLLFVPPDTVGGGYLLGWTLALYVGWTLVLLPYTAWGAELSGNYNERTRVVGTREACVVLGTVLAAALPAVLPEVMDVIGSGKAETLFVLAIFVGVGLPLTMLLALFRVPEPRIRSVTSVNLRHGLRLVWRNGPFRRLLLAYLLNGTANGFTATLFLLFVENVLATPEQAGLLLLVYFLCGVLSVPLWLRISYRFGKHRSWSVGMAVTCLFFAAVPFLGPGDVWPFMAVCILTGFCLGADLALPASMQADVVDLDTLRSGSQRTGLYFALWSMATKLALALAVGLAFPLLDLAGFEAAGDNDAGALLALSLLYGGAPIVIKLCSIAFIWGYPIDAKRQARLRARIDRRAAAQAAAG